jgi:hypothetical protein
LNFIKPQQIKTTIERKKTFDIFVHNKKMYFRLSDDRKKENPFELE